MLLIVVTSVSCSLWLLVVAMSYTLSGETLSSAATLSTSVPSGKDVGVVLLSRCVELWGDLKAPAAVSVSGVNSGATVVTLSVKSASALVGRSEDELTGGAVVASAVLWPAPPGVLSVSLLLVSCEVVLSGTTGRAVVQRRPLTVSSVDLV